MVEVAVLGTVALRDGETVVAPPSPVARRLLGLLALAPSGLSDAALTDAMWGDGASRSALSVAVLRLRTWLRTHAGDAVHVERTPTGYRLAGRVDARVFTELVRAADGQAPEDQVPVLAEALALWQGEPPVDGEPARAAVDELNRVHRGAVLAYGKALLAVGEAERAAESVRPLAGEDPLDEQLHAVLIEALAASGRQAEALSRYERIRLRLADELGVDPGRDLSGALVRVLRQEWPTEPREAPAALVPAQLPPDTATFTGRERQVAELDALLARSAGSVVISAVAGIGGVGKTTLALHWAHRVAERFPDGQLHVDLRGFSFTKPVRPIEALGRFVRALGGTRPVPADVDEAAALYRSLLAGKRVLVVLDNAADVAQVRPLLPGTPGCLVLITSRERLDGLVAREGAHRLSLDVLAPAESVALLAEVLGDERVAREPEAAAELAGLCGHLPLALRIVAANLAAQPDLPVAEQVRALRGDRLAELAIPGDPTSSVRAAFDLSYRRLSPADRRVFRLLGHAPGTDLTTTAAAVLTGLSESDTRRALTRLAAAHLVRRAGDRYSCHDLVGEYARAQERDADEEAAVTGLCRWYLGTAAAAMRLWQPQSVFVPVTAPVSADFPDARAAEAWLSATITNLAAVVDHAATHGPYEIAWSLCDVLRPVFARGEHTPLGLGCATAAMSAAERAGSDLGLVAANLALAVHSSVDARDASPYYEQALVAARRAGWVAGELASLLGLGGTHARAGRLRTAIELYDDVLALSRRHGVVEVELRALGNLGVTHHDAGDLAGAEAYLKTSIARSEEMGWTTHEVVSLGNLGNLYSQTGRFTQARETLAAALDKARQVQRWSTECSVLDSMAEMERLLGNHDTARRLALSALDMANRINLYREKNRCLITLGEIAHAAGDHEEAVAYCRQAVAMAGRGDDLVAEADALSALAMAYCGTGAWSTAVRYAQGALVLAAQAKGGPAEAYALTALATVYLGQGRADLAATHAERALERSRACGVRPREGQALRLLGDARAAQHRLAEARTHRRAAERLYTQMGATWPLEGVGEV